MVFSILLLSGCDEDSSEEMPGADFDRSAMLQQVADDLVIPNFQTLRNSVDQLAVETEAFVQNPDEERLADLRSAWIEAAIDHQYCSAFGFGPGELLLGPYATVLGVFPVDEEKIESNIVSESFDLPNSFDRDIRGFYAIEYLIFRGDISDEALITSFDTNRSEYLSLIVDEIQSTVNGIVNEWNGSYRQSFIESNGTSAGSSISLYYNEFVKDYENLKNFKVELPAGLTAGQTQANGTLVEAFYSGISSELIEHHFENSKNIWSGTTRDGRESTGFKEYLMSVAGGPQLVEVTQEAITEIDQAIASLPEGPLSESVDAAEVVILRDRLQDNTANFKSSMSSLLGISITFNSGDGD